jgi:hypothetical protein
LPRAGAGGKENPNFAAAPNPLDELAPACDILSCRTPIRMRGLMAKKQPKGRRPPPKCKAILLCDQTIVEAVTGKTSVIGIFDSWTFAQFPSLTRPFMCFLQLTDGIGKYAMSVEVHDLQADKIIAQARIPEIAFPDRSQKVNLMIPVPPLPLGHAGSYDFVVLADGQEIDRQQFQAVQVPGGPQDAGDATQEPEEY